MDGFDIKKNIYIAYKSETSRYLAYILYLALCKRKELDVFYDKTRIEVSDAWKEPLNRSLHKSNVCLIIGEKGAFDSLKKEDYNADEYKKYSEKRSEASKNMQEVKVNALTEFNKTIPYDEMFDVAKKISGSKNVQFEEPKLVNRDGRTLYTKYQSNDIKADTGVFSSVLKSARLENFNSELYIDQQTGEPTYWGSLDLRYQHNGGGSNGMELMRYKYNSKTGWDITDSAGYKYKNGKRITTVSGLTDYYMEYYGYSKETAKAMAQASLDDIGRRSTDIDY